MTISSISIVPPTIASGATATATVTLSGPAPFGGATVAIEPQRRNIVTVPATVLVPEGTVTASFPVTGDTVHGKKERVVDVAATYNGITMTATVTVRPPDGAMQAMPPSAIQCASAALVPCLTATATPAITTFASTDYARRYSFYTPELNLMAETEETALPAPRIEYEYIWFAGQPLAQVNRTTGEVAWYFNDHLGTPLLQTDSSATVAWRAEYEPYGAVQTFRAGAEKYQPLRFPGQEAGDSELAYNIFRWYRAGWGRYSQFDPLMKEIDHSGEYTGLNPYQYVTGRPTVATDPLGLASCKPCDKCPSGEWTIEPFGWGLSAAAIGGLSYTKATYQCRDNFFRVSIETTCVIAGAILGAGAGITTPGNACGCNVSDLIGWTKGWTGWMFVMTIDVNPCSVPSVGSTSQGTALGKAFGAGFGKTWCYSEVVKK